MMKKSVIFSIMLLFPVAWTPDLHAANGRVLLKVFPSSYKLTADGKQVKTIKITKYLRKIYLPKGERELVFSSEGYSDRNVKVKVSGRNSLLEVKLEKKTDLMKHVATLHTGLHPKSVEFTPDGKFFVAALLKDRGVDLFTTDGFKKVKRIAFPARYLKKEMFVETVFLPEKNEMWVSQMSASSIHIVDMKDFKYKSTFPTKGIWTKVMAFTPDKKLAFASNWVSEDVSVIDTDSHKVIKKIRVSGIPRGMVVTNDGKYLYVCIFENGQIQKIDLKKLRVVKTMRFPKGAKRHVVMDRKKNIMYITDMYRGSVYVISAVDDRVIKEIKVDQKLNTCKLTPDGNYLLVSSRGPNNRESYLKKGPKFGKIYIIDTRTLKIRDWIWGRNQPTGLDITHDGKYAAFTNFLDNEVEVYKLNLD